ncbi:hypothetical protein SESBI_31615 [Sesbania bispinosa]|nr:hypothetical protein SESBI_31615 [Sesbania bispinosa]
MADQEVAKKCYTDSLKVRQKNLLKKEAEHRVFFSEHDPRVDFVERRPQPTEELNQVQLKGDGQNTRIIPTIDKEEVMTVEVEPDSWMSPIVTFLEPGRLPDSAQEARKIRRDASNFTIVNGHLY